MSKFERIDAQIRRRIANNPGITFVQISRAEVQVEANSLATATTPPGRVVDARLQALRRQRKIEFRRKGANSQGGWFPCEESKA